MSRTNHENDSGNNITIFLRHSNGKGQRLTLPSSSSVQSAIPQIEQKISLQGPEHWKLFFRGKELASSKDSLKEIGFQDQSIIHILPKQPRLQKRSIQIKVKLQEHLFESLYDLQTLISEIKNDIIDEYTLKPELLYLCHLGEELKNTATLQDSGIVEDTWISGQYFGEFWKTNSFDMGQIRLAESMDLEGSPLACEFNPFMKKFQNAQSRGPFDNMFSSAISQSVEYESQHELPYLFSENTKRWEGNCFVFLKDQNDTKQFTIDCKGAFTIKKLTGIIAKLEKKPQQLIVLYNPIEKTKFSFEGDTSVAQIPWTGRISAQILVIEVIYDF